MQSIIHNAANLLVLGSYPSVAGAKQRQSPLNMLIVIPGIIKPNYNTLCPRPRRDRYLRIKVIIMTVSDPLEATYYKHQNIKAYQGHIKPLFNIINNIPHGKKSNFF